MKHVLAAAVILLGTTLSANAVTIDNGVVVFTQADALAGNVTPGDTPGFPVTISVVGSYRLGSNLQVNTNVSGIEVTAPEVSIDLAGFRLSGGGVGRHGIVGLQRGLGVRNGTVRAFTVDGVRTTGSELLVENMRLAGNGRYGVFENAPETAVSIISHNIITGNSTGIYCSQVCLIEGNNITNNTSVGVTGGVGGSSILGNVISYNGTYAVSANVYTGLGNNTIVGNGLGSTTATLLPLHPNACFPQPC